MSDDQRFITFLSRFSVLTHLQLDEVRRRVAEGGHVSQALIQSGSLTAMELARLLRIFNVAVDSADPTDELLAFLAERSGLDATGLDVQPRQLLEQQAANRATFPEPGAGQSATLQEGEATVVELTVAPGKAAPPEGFQHVPETVGKHRINGVLGQGGMGIVLDALDTTLNRRVALKLLLHGQYSSETQVKRFHQEAAAVAKLHHPGIVEIYEVGAHESYYYFSMELVEGRTLQQLLEEDTPLPVLLGIFSRVCEAVDYAHAQGVIHRDLKPANILVDPAGHPKVTDFGLAKFSGQEGTRLTESHALMGTPAYMSPEQASGATREVGHLSDVYSLGVILYEILTRNVPFHAETSIRLLYMITSEEPRAPRQLRPEIPADLETICLKALEKDPQRRYPSARALRDDIINQLSGEAIQARPVSVMRKAGRRLRRYRLGLAFAAVAVALTGGAAWYIAHGKLQSEQQEAAHKQAELAGRSALNEGMTLLEQGKLDLAIAAFRRALQSDKKLLAAHGGLGVALQRKGDLQAALASLDRAIEGGEKSAPLFYHRGLVHHQRKAPENAVADLTRAIELQPGIFRFYLARGKVYRQLGKTDQAIADLDRGGKLRDQYVKGVVARARGLAEQDLDGALRLLNELAEKHPEVGLVYVERAALRVRRGATEGAVADYMKAILLAPADETAYLALARLYQQQKQPAKAITLLTDLIRNYPAGPNVYVLRGNLYFLDRDSRLQTSADFSHVLRQDPDHRGALLGRARAAIRHKDWPKARQDIDRLIRLDPGRAEGHYWLAELESAQDRGAKALAAYSKTLQIDPNHVDALVGRAQVHLTYFEQLPQALADLRKASRLRPEEPRVLRALSSLYSQMGRHADALALINRVIAGNKPRAFDYLTRAGVLYATGKLLQAEQDLRRVISLAPRRERLQAAYQRLEKVLMDQGRSEEARKVKTRWEKIKKETLAQAVGRGMGGVQLPQARSGALGYEDLLQRGKLLESDSATSKRIRKLLGQLVSVSSEAREPVRAALVEIGFPVLPHISAAEAKLPRRQLYLLWSLRKQLQEKLEREEEAVVLRLLIRHYVQSQREEKKQLLRLKGAGQEILLRIALGQRYTQNLRMLAGVALPEFCKKQVPEEVIYALASPRAEVRGVAALVLSEVGQPGSEPHLLPLLEDPVAPVRYFAVRALGKLMKKNAVPYLLAALERERDTEVVRLIVINLKQLAGDDPRVKQAVTHHARKDSMLRQHLLFMMRGTTREELEKLVKSFEDEDPIVRHTALFVVTAVGWRYEEVYDEESAKRKRWFEELKVAEKTAKYLDDPHYMVRFAANLGLYELGVVKYNIEITRNLKDPVGWVALCAAVWLDELRERRAIPALREAALDERPGVAAWALYALARFQDPRALEMLKRVLPKEKDSESLRQLLYALARYERKDASALLIGYLGHQFATVRNAAAWGLVNERRGLAVLDRLLAPYESGSALQQQGICQVLGELRDGRGLPLLDKALRHRDFRVRRAAVDALGEFGRADLVERIRPLLADVHPRVRQSAAWALGQCGTEQARNLARQALSDPEVRVKLAAAHTLASLGGGQFRQLALPHLEHADYQVRKMALDLMAMGSAPLKRFEAALEDDDQRLKARARLAAGLITPDDQSAEKVAEWLGSEVYAQRRQALELIGFFRLARFRKQLETMLETKDLRESVLYTRLAWAAARLGARPKPRWLPKAARNWYVGEESKLRAAWALALLGDRKIGPALKKLTEKQYRSGYYDMKRTEETRILAAEALYQVGGDTTGFPLLLANLASGDPLYRMAAHQSLRRMLEQDFGYQPLSVRSAREDALRRIRAWYEKKTGKK